MIRSEDTNEKTVGHIVARDYRKSRALTKHGVDYSCGGHRTLGQAFAGKAEEMESVLQEWQKIDRQPAKKDLDFLGWDIPFLINYIIQLHHRFVTSQTKFMTELAFKVADANSERHPEIRLVAELFEKTGERLEAKGRKEETELFPYLIKLHEAMIKSSALKAGDFDAVGGPIGKIKTEGEQIVAAFGKIRELTKNYTVPSYTTSTCKILYKMLEEYEADTLLHLHLENNILFPRASETEACLRANQLLT